LSQKSAIVADNGETTATVAQFGDSRTFLRQSLFSATNCRTFLQQCGQALRQRRLKQLGHALHTKGDRISYFISGSQMTKDQEEDDRRDAQTVLRKPQTSCGVYVDSDPLS